MSKLILSVFHVSTRATVKRGLVVLGFIFVSILISGCGTIKTLDTKESDLMPKSVAMEIFKKYGFNQWAEKPFMTAIPGSLFCNREKQFVEFNQIDTAFYQWTNLTFMGHKDTLFCGSLWIQFTNVTESQALELTNAARALGATKIKKLEWRGTIKDPIRKD